MKITIILIFILSSTFVYSQSDESTKVKIDTVKVNYTIKDIADITSFVPQIKSGVNPVAKEKINLDLKGYFQASSIKQDSATYVKELLAHYNVKSKEEYFEVKKDQKEWNPSFKEGNPYYYGDELEEGFYIEYLSEKLLNISISHHILPYGGQPGFSFNSVVYDLTTGNKLDFDDFLSIDKEILLSIFRREGYSISWLSDPDKPFEIIPIDQNDEYVEENLNDLFKENDRCIEFYFSKKDNDIHLMFKFLCAGPHLLDYGISLSKLLPYLKHYEFKNQYKLWGKDINSLRGYDYLTLGNKIEFDNYSILNSGSGYLLSQDNNLLKEEFGIVICHSSISVFYLFLKYQTINNVKKATVLDILEIKRKDLASNTKVTEYCETKKGADAEIFAIVIDNNDNPEFYTEIIKAWRANRKTEQFELIDRKKVKKCGNESYGI